MNKAKLVIILIIIIVLLFVLMQSTENKTTGQVTADNLTQSYKDRYTIANWNLQAFGPSKASNITLMQSYIYKMKNYDIIFVQEIRDSTHSAFPSLCAMMPKDYECKSSSRAGRSTSKEQYGIIYNKTSIRINEFIDFNPDPQNRWERPPVKVTFDLSSFNLTVYNIHVKPEDVKNELIALETLVNTTTNAMIIGDLNADCTYYKPAQEPEFDSWNWIIADSEDTTVANTYCAYDRVIISSDIKDKIMAHGVDTNVTREMSDHYLVWVEVA